MLLLDPGAHFSDMRHPSGVGARQYSQKLGEALTLKGVLKAEPCNRSNNTWYVK